MKESYFSCRRIQQLLLPILLLAWNAHHPVHAEIALLSRPETGSGHTNHDNNNHHQRHNVRGVMETSATNTKATTTTTMNCSCDLFYIIPRRVNVSGEDTIQEIVANKTYDDLLSDYVLWLFQDKPIEQVRLVQPIPGVVFVDTASGISVTINKTDVLFLDLFGYISWSSPPSIGPAGGGGGGSSEKEELDLLRNTVASWLGIAPVHAHGLTGPELHRMTAILMTITDSDFALTLTINDDCHLLATSDLSVSQPIQFGTGYLRPVGTIGVAAGYFAAMRFPDAGVYNIQYSYKVSGKKYITGFVGMIQDDLTIVDLQVKVVE